MKWTLWFIAFIAVEGLWQKSHLELRSIKHRIPPFYGSRVLKK
ncbi:hypothetical protein OGZ01_12750 [Vibrio harveyi]|nr:hypothetical protein [Vibrio harveyi]